MNAATRAATTAATVGLALVSVVHGARAQKLELALAEQSAANRAAAATQVRINELEERGQESLTRYRQLLTEASSYQQYNEQLGAQVTSQGEELAKIRRQLDEVEVTAREVLPLMQKMVDALEQFVALDVPFLLEERQKRVANLKSIMPRADVSISEKYRRILEAYQIEMEFGRTLDAFDGKLSEGGVEKTVELVRLGRVSLMYRTLDGQEVGYWDQERRTWVEDNGYAHDIREALRVAKKQGAPDLLFFPVPAPTKVSR